MFVYLKSIIFHTASPFLYRFQKLYLTSKMNSKSFVAVLLVTFMIGAMMVEIAEAGCDTNGCCNCSRYTYIYRYRYTYIYSRHTVIRMKLLCIKQAGLYYIFQAKRWKLRCSWTKNLYHRQMYLYKQAGSVLWQLRWEGSSRTSG